jgi:L-threonylcarbamoyladenylate synthase
MAAHVDPEIAKQIGLIVDGGVCQVGIESTVLDLTVSPARILRPGMIPGEAIEPVIGFVARESLEECDKTLKSPGLLKRHYAPKGTARVFSWRDDADLKAQLGVMLAGSVASAAEFKSCYVLAHSKVPALDQLGGVSVIPHDPEAYARALYAALHEIDAAGAQWIIIEDVPRDAKWRAIRDRLDRACAK